MITLKFDCINCGCEVELEVRPMQKNSKDFITRMLKKSLCSKCLKENK